MLCLRSGSICVVAARCLASWSLTKESMESAREIVWPSFPTLGDASLSSPDRQ